TDLEREQPDGTAKASVKKGDRLGGRRAQESARSSPSRREDRNPTGPRADSHSEGRPEASRATRARATSRPGVPEKRRSRATRRPGECPPAAWFLRRVLRPAAWPRRFASSSPPLRTSRPS